MSVKEKAKLDALEERMVSIEEKLGRIVVILCQMGDKKMNRLREYLEGRA